MLEIKKSTFDLSWMGLSIFAQKYLHKYEDTYQSFHVKPNGAACGPVRRDMRTFKTSSQSQDPLGMLSLIAILQ